MFSKKLFRSFVISGSLLSLMGCGEYLNNKKQVAEVIEFETKELSCLEKLPQQYQKFVEAEASNAEVDELFQCTKNSLIYFKEKTFGKNQSSYTPEEIRSFFGKFLLKENNFSKDFSLQVMKLKQILIGGSLELITKEEINDVLRIIDVLKEESKVLGPHLKVLLGKSEIKLTWQQVSDSSQALGRSLQKIVVQTRLTKNDFSYQDVKGIIHAFSDIREEKSFGSEEIKLESRLHDVELIFDMLMGEKSNFQTQREWNRGINTMVSLMDLMLKFKYFNIKFNLSDAANNQNLYKLALQLIDTLENSPMMQKKGFIPVSILDQILREVLPKYTTQVSPTAAIKFYKIVLMKMLDPSRQGDIRSLAGIENKHLATLKRELTLWSIHQKFIDTRKFSTQGTILYSDLNKDFKNFKFEIYLPEKIRQDALEKEALTKAWSDVGRMIAAPFPVALSGLGQLQLHPYQKHLSTGWYGLTQVNAMRFLSRFLMIGYANNKVIDTLQNSVILRDGLVQWYSDFTEIGYDLKAFDPRTGNTGGRSFLESNFFTLSGDGNAEMNFIETFEFVSLLFASGLGSSSTIFKDIQEHGCGLKRFDVMGFEKVNLDCARKVLKIQAKVYFRNMPRMANYVNNLNTEGWTRFFNFLFNASLVSDQKSGEMEISNLRSMVTIMHYIEGIYSVYDANRDDQLSVNEVRGAANRFLPFFRMLRPDSGDTVLNQVYLYLVFEGGIPSASDLAKFQISRMRGLENITRMEIARLFGALKGELDRQ